MGKGCSSQPYYQQPLFPSANLNCSGMPPDPGVDNVQPLSLPTSVNPEFSVSLPKMILPCGPHLLHYNYPYMPCASYWKQQESRDPVFPRNGIYPDTEVEETQKSLFIIDHSGKRTSLFISSLSPVTAKKESFVLPEGTNRKEYCFVPECLVNSSGLDMDEANVSGGEKSELREDTEEIDALLFSDDENEDDEEVSTGHSPLDLLAKERNENIADDDEVSSFSPTKKIKLDRSSLDIELMDTANSRRAVMKVLAPGNHTELCVKVNSLQQDLPSQSGSNHPWGRNERIHEAVGVLRNVIPGSKGKDAIVVLEEAIQYLRSLSHKAKALGVGSLVE